MNLYEVIYLNDELAIIITYRLGRFRFQVETQMKLMSCSRIVMVSLVR